MRQTPDVHGTVLPRVLERLQWEPQRHSDLALVITEAHDRADRDRAAVAGYQEYGHLGLEA